jgi:hypothetical protein
VHWPIEHGACLVGTDAVEQRGHEYGRPAGLSRRDGAIDRFDYSAKSTFTHLQVLAPREEVLVALACELVIPALRAEVTLSPRRGNEALLLKTPQQAVDIARVHLHEATGEVREDAAQVVAMGGLVLGERGEHSCLQEQPSSSPPTDTSGVEAPGAVDLSGLPARIHCFCTHLFQPIHWYLGLFDI